MAISASSIIHYTEEFETLCSILSEKGFRISYCSEKVVTRGNKSFSFGIAMISFCDIPLSDYKKQFKRSKDENLGYYGDYGIGLSKEWAKKNGLNPVLYIDTNSYAGTALRKSVELFKNLNAKTNTDIKSRELKEFEKNEFAQFACYAKNYQGDLHRKGKCVKKQYKYYDEREWRYVPQSDKINDLGVILDNDDYLKNKDTHNNQIKEFNLNFSISDISYIIVKDETEISNLILLLKRTFKEENSNDLEILFTKILTSSQIFLDF